MLLPSTLIQCDIAYINRGQKFAVDEIRGEYYLDIFFMNFVLDPRQVIAMLFTSASQTTVTLRDAADMLMT